MCPSHHARQEDFSRFELSLRYSMVAFSLATLWRYWSSFQLQGGRIAFRTWQPAQQVMLLLIVANLLYNNPFLGLWYSTGEWYWQMIELLEQ